MPSNQPEVASGFSAGRRKPEAYNETSLIPTKTSSIRPVPATTDRSHTFCELHRELCFSSVGGRQVTSSSFALRADGMFLVFQMAIWGRNQSAAVSSHGSTT